MKMTCKEAAELMSQAQERRLGFFESFALRMHLWVCIGCANYRRQLDMLRQACRRFSGRDD
jgi:hypothetical protein